MWLATVLTLNVSAVSCAAGPEMKTVEWREEVRLRTGEVIVAERSQTFRRVSEPGAGSGWLFETGRILGPLGASSPQGGIVWEGPLQPLAMDVAKDGAIYLVGVVGAARGRITYKLPEAESHAAFKYLVAGQWERIPLSQVPDEIRPNLLFNVHAVVLDAGFVSRSLVNVSAKVKADNDPSTSRILRDWKTR